MIPSVRFIDSEGLHQSFLDSLEAFSVPESGPSTALVLLTEGSVFRIRLDT
jgi:hypothetical protein